MGTEHHSFQDELSFAVGEAIYLWGFWKQFFGAPGGADVLNERTGHLFGHFQAAMSDAVILEIAKVLDSDGNAVSVRKAIAQLGDHQPEKPILAARLDVIRERATSLLMHRDKRIAHSDRSVALGRCVLPPVSHSEIEALLEDLAKIMDDIWRAHGRGQIVTERGGVLAAQEDWEIEEFYKLMRAGLECRRDVP